MKRTLCALFGGALFATTAFAGANGPFTWQGLYSLDLSNSGVKTSAVSALANGSTSAAAYTWLGDENTGWYRNGADDIGMSVGGSTMLQSTPTTGVAIRGVTSGAAAATAFVGETLQSLRTFDKTFGGSSGQCEAMPSDADGSGASSGVTLTAGSWLVSGAVQITGNGGPTSLWEMHFSTSNGTTKNPVGSYGDGRFEFGAGATAAAGVINPMVLNLSGSTTYYMKFCPVFSSAPHYRGVLRAIRIR